MSSTVPNSEDSMGYIVHALCKLLKLPCIICVVFVFLWTNRFLFIFLCSCIV
uniref:Uncharacterized protein n=1 Tax=Anguilla anguilla TaxID=7936 RepID=A0A0E9VDQ8_ANGAN